MDTAKDCIAFLQLTAGRDKVYRTLQYLSRLLLRVRFNNDDNDDDGGTSLASLFLQAFESHMTISRKLFRLFNVFEFAIKALEARQNPDVVLSALETCSLLLKSLWMVFDHVIWLSKVLHIPFDAESMAKKSNWSWLLALILCIVQDIYKIKIRKTQQSYWDLIRDACDLLIPVGNLRLIGWHDRGSAGLFGVISSLMKAREIWTKDIRTRKTRRY